MLRISFSSADWRQGACGLGSEGPLPVADSPAGGRAARRWLRARRRISYNQLGMGCKMEILVRHLAFSIILAKQYNLEETND